MIQKTIEMDQETKRLLSPPQMMHSDVELNGQKYYLKEFISSKGYKSVVWKGVDKYSSPVVIKFATYEDYMNRSYIEEATKAAQLRSYPEFFAYFYDASIIELQLSEERKTKFICFIEEWIKGQVLQQYIQENEITPSFIVSYVREMCKALNILKELNFRHDDLHLGNVMIASPKKEALSEEFTVRIIDMGSLKPYEAPLKKEKDDHGRFTEHLISLCNSMLFNSNLQRKPLSLKERRFRAEIIPLLNSMVEEDKQVALFDPSKILAQFEHANTRVQNPYKEVELRLEDPFDYICAEHITSDKLLVQLFAESCPWIKEVTSPNPVLLTGPRGCGKSMVFRRLSLKAILCKSQDDIKDSQICGFYVSCSAEIRNRFGWISSEIYAKRFQNEIRHYFNLLLSREIIQTLLLISKREDRETIFGFGKVQEKETHDFLINKLMIKEERRLRLQGVTPLEHLQEIIEFEMSLCYEQILKGFNLDSVTPISFLSDLTKFLKNNIRYFRNRTITFLLDDFSIHRISEPVQLLLNSIIWDRQATHIFKLSAEKYGVERVLDFNSESAPTADLTREFREIDCGQFYIDLHDKGLLKDLINFAKDLLDHRLALAKHSENSETIIGHYKYEELTLGKALRSNPKARDQYHGLETIAQICSGDISALLEIYRRIFKEAKVDKDTKSMVPKHIQHAAIVSVSRSFLELIKTYQPFGDEMYKIILNFGTLCRRILVEGKDETTRIEVDQIPGKSGEEWTEDQQKMMKELVRRAIFIEMETGRGRASLGPTWRWQLRRIYCPAFATGLSKTTAIKWNDSQLKYFLTNPQEHCNAEFKKWGKTKQGPDLFSKSTTKEETNGEN